MYCQCNVSLDGAPTVSLPAASTAKLLLKALDEQSVAPRAWTEDALLEFAKDHVYEQVPNNGCVMFVCRREDSSARGMSLDSLQKKMRRLAFSLRVLRKLCDSGESGTSDLLRRLANSRFHVFTSIHASSKPRRGGMARHLRWTSSRLVR